MGFLIKSAFWLSLALLLIPVDTGEAGHTRHVSAFQALVAAGEAASDVADMCQRKPEVCAVGRSALDTIGARAGVAAKFAYDMLDAHFRNERLLGFYAEKLSMTPDRLNDHVKRATGVTAGHLIRQRVLTEAKRQLVFTGQAIHEIAYDLAFSDPSHFTRFFRKQTGMTPQAFRDGRGG